MTKGREVSLSAAAGRDPGSAEASAAGHEFALIEWIREQAKAHPRVGIGIGDDAALLRFPAAADCLLAVDTLMEGTHFTSETPPRLVGRKALAVNLSDIAAMAGRPLAALVSVALSRRHGPEAARELAAGVQELADEFGVAVAGGDTNIWDGPLVVSLTVIGEATGRSAVRRSGARVGDWIVVTGEFGGSLQGRHLSFRPRVEEALRLHELAALHAMIDVSDGLVADLYHILDESGVGAVLEADAIPISEVAGALNDGRSPLEHALEDGEDFELLFTVRPEEGRQLPDALGPATPLTKIGEIVAGSGAVLLGASGHRRSLQRSGWEHSF